MSKWKPIGVMPAYTPVLIGLWVHSSKTNKATWEYYVAEYIEDEDFLADIDGGELPWQKEDFDGWMPLPEPPPEEKKDE